MDVSENRIKYNETSNIIYDLEKSSYDRILNEFGDISESIDNANGIGEETDPNAAHTQLVTLIALYCIRMKYGLRLWNDGYTIYKTSVTDDLDYVKGLLCDFYGLKQSEEIVDESIKNIVSIICGECFDMLSRYIETSQKSFLFLKKKNAAEQKIQKLNLLVDVGIDYLLYDHHDEGDAILKYACRESETIYDVNTHKEFLNTILGTLYEVFPTTAIDIARRYMDFYKNKYDDSFGLFLYYYGDALFINRDYKASIKILEKCLEVRGTIYDQGSWNYDIVKRECDIVEFIRSKEHEGGEGLKRFVDKIEEGAYPEIDEGIKRCVEGKTLSIMLMHGGARCFGANIEHYFAIFGRLCSQIQDDPIVNMRIYHVRRAAYYLYKELYLLSESEFLKALEIQPTNGRPLVSSDVTIMLDLLMIYAMQNDYDKEIDILSKLHEVDAEEELSTELKIRLLNNTVMIESNLPGGFYILDPDELMEEIDKLFEMLIHETERGSALERVCVITSLVSQLTLLESIA